jgi:hypothetical protein
VLPGASVVVRALWCQNCGASDALTGGLDAEVFDHPHFDYWPQAGLERAMYPSSDMDMYSTALSRGDRTIAACDWRSGGADEFRRRFEGLADVERLVVSRRLLTLTGIVGCDTTKVAARLANRIGSGWPDGAWWVDLQSAIAPDTFPSGRVGRGRAHRPRPRPGERRDLAPPPPARGVDGDIAVPLLHSCG